MNKVKLTQKQINQLQLIRQICAAAKSYKTQLVGKTFLYIFDDRYIEVMFKVTNFRHLTGVESSLSAREFYNKAVRNQLQTNLISFSSNHPYELCLKKITHITDIANLAQSESFMLEQITTQRKPINSAPRTWTSPYALIWNMTIITIPKAPAASPSPYVMRTASQGANQSLILHIYLPKETTKNHIPYSFTTASRSSLFPKQSKHCSRKTCWIHINPCNNHELKISFPHFHNSRARPPKQISAKTTKRLWHHKSLPLQEGFFLPSPYLPRTILAS